MNKPVATPRTGFVLIAVLVIIGSAALVATALLFMAQTHAAASVGQEAVEQSRALAWSGVQVVIRRLDEQREQILSGQAAQLDVDQLIIYQTPQRLGVVRVLPIGADNVRSLRSRRGSGLSAEAGKLDLNSISAEELTATGMIDRAAADAIVAHRQTLPGRAFQSVGDLLSVPGANVTAELLYGSLDEMTPMDDAQLKSGDLKERVAARLADEPARCLADVVTVFSVEPAIQQSGKRRMNLNMGWSEDLGRKVADRFGQQSADVLKQIFESGATFENEAKIFQTLRFFKTPPQEWPPIIDAFTTDEGEFHIGRLDINSAPKEALMGLPGISAEVAARLVSARDELPPQDRATIAWPVIAKIVEPQAYDKLAGRITTRCWTYRVRVAAGEVDAEYPDGAMAYPVIYEAVIDMAAPKARVAYLREITLLQDAVMVAQGAMAEQATDRDDQMPELPQQPNAERTDDSPATAPANTDSPASQPAKAHERNQRIGRWLVGR
ncbi:MAG: helix-hairpin-helix domain-containing protein [Phycisphaerales bacterium]|nr:helix-hairpin-helix domain-containing protein [Phycisphaerales bacterium]MCI0675261.1 helix-hairpin-helix domain-containing protein [Phycisphaerales bacterium]